jgi:hypothetical protein
LSSWTRPIEEYEKDEETETIEIDLSSHFERLNLSDMVKDFTSLAMVNPDDY